MPHLLHKVKAAVLCHQNIEISNIIKTSKDGQTVGETRYNIAFKLAKRLHNIPSYELVNLNYKYSNIFFFNFLKI